MALPIAELDAAQRWPDGHERQSSLVVQTSYLGDVVLTTPLVAELARRGPVDVVVRPDAAALLAGSPAIRRVIVFDKRGADRGPAGLWRTARRIRASAAADGGRRVAYVAQGSVRSGLLTALSGYEERVGFSSSRHARRFYTRVVPFLADRHHAERLWRLAMPADATATAAALSPRLYPGHDEARAVDAVLPPSPIDGPVIALAPGSVWATKRWPGYPALAARIAARGGRIVVVGAATDRSLAEAILAACPPDAAVDATGRLSLLASAELLSRCAALVTNDSAPQHLASAMGVPTLTIFGPTVPAFGFGPLAPRSATVGHEALACRPCDPHGPKVCPLGHWRCMRELTVGDVDAALQHIAAPAGRPA